MRRSLAFALLCAALHAAPARAQQAPPPQFGYQEAPRAARFVLAMGFDSGADLIVDVPLTDGSHQTLRAGEGFFFSAGASFLERNLGAVTADALATIGVKGWNASGSDGGVNYLAFPLEVLGRVRYRQARFGAGIDYAMSPKITSSGVLSYLGDVPLQNALGFVMHADWAARQPGAKAGFFLGARVVLQSLESKETGKSVNANSFGLQLGMDF